MEQFDARMKSLLKDEYDDFKKALLEKPVKGLYLNRNKKNVERVLDKNYVEHHPIVENGYLYDENYHPGMKWLVDTVRMRRCSATRMAAAPIM